PQVGRVAIGALADDVRLLVVARYLRAQELELWLASGLEILLRLFVRGRRLRQSGLRDRHETICERRVEVGLRHFELQLRACRIRCERRVLQSEVGLRKLRTDAAAGVDELRTGNGGAIDVALAEGQLAEI